LSIWLPSKIDAFMIDSSRSFADFAFSPLLSTSARSFSASARSSGIVLPSSF
jgi:hypothetical protein